MSRAHTRLLHQVNDQINEARHYAGYIENSLDEGDYDATCPWCLLQDCVCACECEDEELDTI